MIRFQVWSNSKMVTLHGAPVVHEGEPRLLSGTADERCEIAAVKLDGDGRELLIARRDLEVLT